MNAMTLFDRTLWGDFTRMVDENPGIMLFALIGGLLIALITWKIGMNLAKKPEYDVYGKHQDASVPTTRVRARIISKTEEPLPASPTIKVNYLAFECEGGQRMSFAIPDPALFRESMQGDEGELTYCGRKFVSFRRT